MKSKLLNILKNHWSKILSVSFFILLLGAYANIFAIGQPYNPGSTLDPECSPLEENCTISASPWLTGLSGIYYEEENYASSSTGTGE